MVQVSESLRLSSDISRFRKYLNFCGIKPPRFQYKEEGLFYAFPCCWGCGYKPGFFNLALYPLIVSDFLSGIPTMNTTSFYDRPTRVGANLLPAVLVTCLQLSLVLCLRAGENNKERNAFTW